MSEGYQVSKNKSATIDAYELAMWIEVYCTDECGDTCMNQLFADKLHVDKGKATTIAHRIALMVKKGCVNLGHV